MKRPQIILSIFITVLALTAYSFVNQKENEMLFEPVELKFPFDINSRFSNTITKEGLKDAQTIHDLLPTTKLLPMNSYYNVSIQAYSEQCQMGIPQIGHDGKLSYAQKELLQSLDYGSNFYISAREKSLYPSIGCQSNDSLIYYITVVPHKQAFYSEGKEELISYLEENSQNVWVDLQSGQLKPGKIHFVVTGEGNIEEVRLSSSSGFESIDNKMINLIQNLHGKWNGALDAKGEKVDEELVLSFGMIGC